MTELGDVLELLHDSRARWRAIRAHGIEWSDRALSFEAFSRRNVVRNLPIVGRGIARGVSASLRASVSVTRADGSELPEESTEPWAYWQEGDRKRAEFPGGDGRVMVVYEGDTFWSWSPSQGGRTNAGRTNEMYGLGPAPALIDTAAILSELHLRVVGQSELIGRRVTELIAEPRPARNHRSAMQLHGLGSGAEEYRFAVDAERGVLLRSEARLEDRPFRVIEMTEVAFDEELPSTTFEIELPDGEDFDSTDPFETVTLDQLPGRVPFKVFAPSRYLGDPTVTVSRARKDGRLVTHVSISYRLHSDRLWLTESAEADSEPDDPDESWGKRGEMSVREEHEEDYVRCKVRLLRAGTALHLESAAAGLDELIAIAESLAEVGEG